MISRTIRGRSVDEVVERLKQGAASASMAIVAHLNGQANAAKRGLSVPGDQILEVFRPDLAIRVWEADKSAGLDIPIRIHVFEQGAATVISYRPPSAVFAPYHNPRLDLIGAELDPVFAAIAAHAAMDG